MPIYEDKDHTYEKLNELRKYNVCSECGQYLSLFRDADGKVFLACHEWPRSHHEGIEREASPFEQTGIESLNLEARRKIMVEQIGEKKTAAMEKYMGVTSLKPLEAEEVLATVFPLAPRADMARAIALCVNYGLNPLMGHVFLIPFNKKDRAGKIIGKSWATVMGIKATRLLGNRKGAVSYIDDTPRIMTQAEQEKVYGRVLEGFICAITKCKDPKSGAEVSGYGKWKVGDTVQGVEKGNSPENMAFIRSERQALDRLRPGEMPMGVDVIDETFISPAPAPEAEPETLGAEGSISEDKVIEGAFREVEEKAPPAPAPQVAAEEEPLFAEPAPNTLADLELTMKECNWEATDLGHFIKQVKKWEIAIYKDLAPEQIAEAIQYIKENPK